MKNIFNIIIKDSKNTFAKYLVMVKKIPWILGNNAFEFILIFIFLGLLTGEFLFYQYVFLPKVKEVESTDAPAVFKERVYQSVLEEWERRQDLIENSAKEDYNNPF